MDWFDWCDYQLRSDNHHEGNGLHNFYIYSFTVCIWLIQFIWFEFAKEFIWSTVSSSSKARCEISNKLGESSFEEGSDVKGKSVVIYCVSFVSNAYL